MLLPKTKNAGIVLRRYPLNTAAANWGLQDPQTLGELIG